ncbi:hypothetical protein I6F11_28475 [Ensifer sp. NBAIM29]|nr:hypothetical protein [Ensifer sp. NBAIM29]
MALPFASFANSACAQSLLEKIKNGDTVRSGFSNQILCAFPRDASEPLGFANAVAIDILKRPVERRTQALHVANDVDESAVALAGIFCNLIGKTLHLFLLQGFLEAGSNDKRQPGGAGDR